MKAITISCLLAILCLSVKAQDKNLLPFPTNNGEYGYEQVVELDSTYTKLKLYNNAKFYFVDLYKSANDVIQLDDKDNYRIIGKGLFKLSDYQSILGLTGVSLDWYVHFTTDIICKDAKYKYRIYDIYIDQVGGSESYGWNRKLSVSEAAEQAKHSNVKKMLVRLYNNTVAKFNDEIHYLKNQMEIKKQPTDF